VTPIIILPLKLTLIVRTGFMFLILLYMTTDYPNSYVDINVIELRIF